MPSWHLNVTWPIIVHGFPSWGVKMWICCHFPKKHIFSGLFKLENLRFKNHTLKFFWRTCTQDFHVLEKVINLSWVLCGTQVEESSRKTELENISIENLTCWECVCGFVACSLNSDIISIICIKRNLKNILPWCKIFTLHCWLTTILIKKSCA